MQYVTVGTVGIEKKLIQVKPSIGILINGRFPIDQLAQFAEVWVCSQLW